jgi:signal transduction histidine kinase
MVLFRNISHILQYENQKNQHKYQEMLAGTMSHEMMTPLNAILSMSTLIEKKFNESMQNNCEDAEKGSTPEYKE